MSGNTVGVSMTLPPVGVVPEPLDIVARGQLSDEAVARRVVAAIRRVFADVAALQP